MEEEEEDFRKASSFFFLKLDEHTRVDWESALEDWKSGVFIALASSQSSYDAFLSLITDGKDL
jgi:hypothetical protein